MLHILLLICYSLAETLLQILLQCFVGVTLVASKKRQSKSSQNLAFRLKNKTAVIPS